MNLNRPGMQSLALCLLAACSAGPAPAPDPGSPATDAMDAEPGSEADAEGGTEMGTGNMTQPPENPDVAADATDTTDVPGDGGPPTELPADPELTAEPDPPALTCTPPISPVDVSSPDHVVGDGSVESCTEQALREAVRQGGRITFDCGGAATLAIRSAIELPLDRDVTLDGGSEIILDGGASAGHRTRIFVFDSPNYRATDTTFTLQHITLQNAHAPASDFTDPDPDNPRCAHGYRDGQGGALYVRDGIVHLIDVVFRDNQAASPGPDTGGGGLYALGSSEVIIVGSLFENNQGSNGGGVGLLQSDGVFVNTTFRANQATGSGANFGGASECGSFNHDQQGGAGGNGGAVAIDGGSVERVSFCGVRFESNGAGALGTVFRTPNSSRQQTRFDRCSFLDNLSGDGGGAIYTQDAELVILDSTFAGNRARGAGGAVRLEQGVHGSTLQMINSTLVNNQAEKALGGALVFDGEGLVRNCTFSGNRALGGYDQEANAAFFGAAIVGGQMRVENTLFVDNADTHPWTPMTCRVDSPMPGGNNLQWPEKRLAEDGSPSDEDDNPCTEDITWADAALMPLADNGGPTTTMLPTAASPAIGLGGDCPPFDQRGRPRPSDGCTAGATELD